MNPLLTICIYKDEMAIVSSSRPTYEELFSVPTYPELKQIIADFVEDNFTVVVHYYIDE